jgi:integrase
MIQICSRTIGREILRRFATQFATFRHLTTLDLHPKIMASIRKQKSGRWRAQVRRKGQIVSETFQRRQDAKAWAAEAERQIERGGTPQFSRIARLTTFGELVDLHVEDMKQVGKAPGRSKDATLRMLKARLGALRVEQLSREQIVQFGRERATEGAGPVTLSMDLGFIKSVITHAAAVHGLQVSAEPVTLARVGLQRLGLVGKSNERDRRPTEDELERLVAFFDRNDRQLIPMSRVIRFAIATAMRQEEIFRVTWQDYEARARMLTIRDRKDPRRKKGNDQRIPLLAVSGYDAAALVEEQRARRANADERIFPYNHKSAGTAFTRACRQLRIADLHFHDLRHEGASRLFEAGLRIEHAALVTGHKDWKMLRRYTHLRPESLHDLIARNQMGRAAELG